MKEVIDNYKYELELNKQGIKLIAGVDEVGRGPLIGPVVAAAVILPENFTLKGLTDSKKLSEKKREEFYKIIQKEALAIGIGIISEKRIDEINIYQATKEAMKYNWRFTNGIYQIAKIENYDLSKTNPFADITLQRIKNT